MSLKAGRRGLHKRLVDAFGNLNDEALGGEYYTKQQTDNKFETKTHVNNTFQKKTLELPIETLMGSKLTVEDSLDTLNEIQKTRQPKTLEVPIEMLSGSKLTVEDALQGLNSDKVSNNCIEIASESDISKLKEGLNAVVVRTGVLLGYTMGVGDQITTSNNMRGVITRHGTTLVGYISNYDGTQFYMLASSELLHIDIVRVIQTKRGGE